MLYSSRKNVLVIFEFNSCSKTVEEIRFIAQATAMRRANTDQEVVGEIRRAHENIREHNNEKKNDILLRICAFCMHVNKRERKRISLSFELIRLHLQEQTPNWSKILLKYFNNVKSLMSLDW